MRAVVVASVPTLVLESVTGAVGVINREPLLVAACRGSKIGKRLAAVEREPHVVEKRLEKAEIEKTPRIIGAQHRVAPEDIVLEHAGKRPGGAAITGISVAALAEVGSNAVELPPTDYHPVAVCRVYGD